MPFVGEFMLFAATACVLASIGFYIAAWRGRLGYLTLARNFFYLSTGFLLGAIATLLYLILTHDFSVAYVFSYSSTDLPFGYLVSSLWAGQEGTFLLWIVFVSIMGLVLIATARDFEIGTLVFVNLFVLSILVILLKRSPFELLPEARLEGAGLNPLLQNFWMQIHPPIMFVGFAAAVIPFCFAMTGLIDRKYHLWAESARTWTLFAFVALGTALVMGGYWAYVTLGWGGFWAWDPVENSSFIPWIFLAAQIHVLFIKRQRRGLMRFSIFMVALTFWSVLYGTFLTRSGVLADFSVHSFIDLGINQFLVAGLLFFVVAGLSLIAWRWSDIKPQPSYSAVASRSYLVSLGVVILFIGGVLTLIGTSAPLLTRVTDNPSAVGLKYYFVTMTPIAIAAAILIGLFPAFRWNKGVSRPRLLQVGGLAAVVVIAANLLTGFTYQPIYLALFGAVAMALITNGYVLVASYREGNFVPGYLAHIGLATALIGASLSAGFESKHNVRLEQNQPTSAMGYDITFTKIDERRDGFDCHVDFQKGSSVFTAILHHDFPKNAEGVMKKPHVHKYLSHDIYIAPLAVEAPEGQDPSMLTLDKGQTARIDKYDITFHNFELLSHGDDGGAATASARLSIAYDGKTEEVAPLLAVHDDSLANTPASFDYQRGTVMIAGISPETGSVMLKVMGDFMPMADAAQAALVIEVSKKPWINLFWLGTAVIFLSAALSMRKRRRRNTAITEAIATPMQEEVAS